MARNDPQMNLRVPVELKEKIEKAAFDNNRTITAEAVSRLEQSFKPHQEIEIEELRKEIRNMNMTIHTLAEALVNKGN